MSAICYWWVPVVNVIIFLQWTLGSLDQLGNTGTQMITHLRIARVRCIVILEIINNVTIINHTDELYLIEAAHIILGT